MNTKNFNNCRETLSNDEIEQLCSLYLAGKLNIEEEKALAKILVSSSYYGEVVDETLFIMGLSAAESHLLKKYKDMREKIHTAKIDIRRSLFNILKISAAVVCFVFSISMLWDYFDSSRNSMEPVYEVYANGRKVSDPEISKRMALKSFAESQRFIAEMKAIQDEKLMDFEKKKLDADRKYKEMKLNLNEIN